MNQVLNPWKESKR